MAGKKIFIEYDIDSSDLKIANQDTLSLTQQLRILKKELQRGDLKPEQFDILRKKIGDTEDQIAKTTVKSKDFFGVLSTLPGPVGQFGSSLLGVIDTLKVFSSFTFKDIKNSLTDVLDDVKEVTQNFTGLNKETGNLSNTNQQASKNSDDLGDSLKNTASDAGATAVALEKTNKSIKDLETNLAKTNVTLDDQLKAYTNLEKQGYKPLYSEIVNQNDVVEKTTLSLKNANGEYIQLTAEQTKAAAAGKLLTVTNDGVVISNNAVNKSLSATTLLAKSSATAVRALTIAWNGLKLAIGAIGIGLLIIALTEGLTLLYEWATGTKAADEANEKLTKSFERLKESIDDTQEALKIQTDLLVLQAKIAGKTEEDIFKITKDGLDKRVKANEEGRKKIENQYLLLSANTILTEEQKKSKLEDLQKELDSIGDRAFALRIEGEKLVLNEELRLADRRRAQAKESADKRLADQREAEQKRIADTKTAEEQISQLVDEITLLRIKDERTRQFQSLENERKNQTDKIKQLLISEELKDNLLRQTRIRFELKNQELTDKFNEEDLNLLKEFNRKKEDIEIAAIEDVREREDAERQIDLRRRLEDLEEDKEFIKLGEIEKEEIRKNLRKSFANEERQILKDDALKLLDDELRFLQIRQEAIRENTKAFFDSQRDILAVSEKRELELAEGKEKELTLIKDKYAKLRKDIDEQEKLATLQAVGETIGAISSLTAAIASSYDEEAKTSKEAFEKRKKLQVATAVMSAASGIIQILAQPSTLPSPADWIVKGINAAALGVTTAVQIDKIKNTQFEDQGGGTRQAGTVRGMANGGIVRGPGGPKSDSIPTNLSNGEAVMTSGAVTMFAPLLSMMNQMGGGTSFSSDLSVASPDNPIRNNPAQEQSPIIMKTYVVESELTSAQQKQGRLKELSTL